MNKITTDSGRVGHIAASVFDGEDGRVVTTACGVSHPEWQFHVDNALDVCKACETKFYNLVEKADDIVLEEEEVPTKASKQPSKTTEDD